GNHADQLVAAVEDGEAPNLVLLHQAGGVLDVLVLEPIDHVGGHDVAYVGHPRIAARCHYPHRDIAVRQHTDHALTITDGERPDIQVTHLLGCFVDAGLGRNHFHPRRHDVFELHR